MRFAHPVTNISRSPDPASVTVSQGLFGEHLEIQSTEGKYCRIRNWRDDYEGYIPVNSIIERDEMSSHFVATASTLMFFRPNIKAPSPLRLMFGSELVIKSRHDNTFSVTDSGFYVLNKHLLPMGTSIARDLAGIAEKLFQGIPYLWGGRSPDGFDCSGLVQMSAFAAGVLLPRDSAMQEAFLTTTVPIEQRRRSDLVFWPGHVAIMLDEEHLLHATAHSMLSLIEPLNKVVARAGEVSAIKRL